MGNKASQIRKNFTKSPYKFNKSYKNYTHVLHISIYTCNLHRSTSSFENKPLIIIDWSLKSIKCSHHHFPNCDQNEKIKKIYSLVKKYYHKYCTHNLSILIKYFISHIFPIFYIDFFPSTYKLYNFNYFLQFYYIMYIHFFSI